MMRNLEYSQYKERNENDVTTNKVMDEVKVLDKFCRGRVRDKCEF